MTTPTSTPAAIAQDLVDFLVCPLGRAPLRLEAEYLICTKCGLGYKVDDGIPNMLIDEARLPSGVTRLEQVACYPAAKQ